MFSLPDDIWIGDIPPSDKPDNTFRITYNNINSLGPRYSEQLLHLHASQHALGIDYLGITE